MSDDTIGKIRGRYLGDTEGLAQWVARKIKNRDPMSERDGSPGQAVKNKVGRRFVKDGQHTRGAVYCGMIDGEPTRLIYGLEDGRIFEMSVREVNPSEAKRKLIAVGA
jgi:hypothetical protein